MLDKSNLIQNKKIAILLSGHARTINFTSSNLKELQRELGADIFIHTWDEQEMKKDTWRSPQLFKPNQQYIDSIRKISSKQILMENQDVVEAYFSKHSSDFSPERLMGIHYMLYGMIKSYELSEIEEYDVVIRHRFDLRINEIKKLKKQVENNSFENTVLMLPHNWGSAIGIWSDVLIVSNPKNYKKFLLDLIKNINTAIYEIEKFEILIPELLIVESIEKSNLTIKSLNCNAELIRVGNCSEQKFKYFVNPFVHKLRSHLKYLFSRMPVKPFKSGSLSYKMWRKSLFK